MDETGFRFLSSVASIEVDSPQTQFFCVSRKRATARDWIKTLVGAS